MKERRIAELEAEVQDKNEDIARKDEQIASNIRDLTAITAQLQVCVFSYYL